MKKVVARLLRRAAQRLDPCPAPITAVWPVVTSTNGTTTVGTVTWWQRR